MEWEERVEQLIEKLRKLDDEFVQDNLNILASKEFWNRQHCILITLIEELINGKIQNL